MVCCSFLLQFFLKESASLNQIFAAVYVLTIKPNVKMKAVKLKQGVLENSVFHPMFKDDEANLIPCLMNVLYLMHRS